MSYTPFDATKPDGATQNGAAFSASANANDVALWLAIVDGQVPGFAFSKTNGTGTDEQPQYFLWTNGSIIVRSTNTWGTSGGDAGNLTQQIIEVSSNGGSTYSAIVTRGYTYTSGGYPATTTNAGGFVGWLAYLLGKAKAIASSLATHVALVGNAVHGLGTISTQNAGAVAITGGTMKGVTIGGTGAGEAKLATVAAMRETFHDYGSGASFTLELDKYSCFRISPNANFSIAFSGTPSSGFAQRVVIEISGASGRTCTLPGGFDWGGAGAPTFSAGDDIITAYSRDGYSTGRFMVSSFGS